MGHESHMGEMRNAYNILIRKLEGKRPLKRPRHSSENNIKMALREIGLKGVNRIRLAQDRDWWRSLVIKIMNILFH
jgi:hypothetical protein